MLPPLSSNGYLPPGVHPATLDEVIARFGQGSEQREAQAQSLQWLVPLCKNAGITRILINGSFVTNRLEPNDVDCVLLQGPTYSALSEKVAALREGVPFIELKIVDALEYQVFIDVIFGTDRNMIRKGIIEVIL